MHEKVGKCPPKQIKRTPLIIISTQRNSNDFHFILETCIFCFVLLNYFTHISDDNLKIQWLISDTSQVVSKIFIFAIDSCVLWIGQRIDTHNIFTNTVIASNAMSFFRGQILIPRSLIIIGKPVAFYQQRKAFTLRGRPGLPAAERSGTELRWPLFWPLHKASRSVGGGGLGGAGLAGACGA